MRDFLVPRLTIAQKRSLLARRKMKRRHEVGFRCSAGYPFFCDLGCCRKRPCARKWYNTTYFYNEKFVVYVVLY